MQKYFQYKISPLMGNLLTLKLALFQISDSLYSRNVIKIMLEKKICANTCVDGDFLDHYKKAIVIFAK